MDGVRGLGVGPSRPPLHPSPHMRARGGGLWRGIGFGGRSLLALLTLKSPGEGGGTPPPNTPPSAVLIPLMLESHYSPRWEGPTCNPYCFLCSGTK